MPKLARFMQQSYRDNFVADVTLTRALAHLRQSMDVFRLLGQSKSREDAYRILCFALLEIRDEKAALDAACAGGGPLPFSGGTR